VQDRPGHKSKKANSPPCQEIARKPGRFIFSKRRTPAKTWVGNAQKQIYSFSHEGMMVPSAKTTRKRRNRPRNPVTHKKVTSNQVASLFASDRNTAKGQGQHQGENRKTVQGVKPIPFLFFRQRLKDHCFFLDEGGGCSANVDESMIEALILNNPEGTCTRREWPFLSMVEPQANIDSQITPRLLVKIKIGKLANGIVGFDIDPSNRKSSPFKASAKTSVSCWNNY